MKKVTSRRRAKKDPRYISRRELERMHNTPECLKMREEARELIKKISLEEWEKVFAETPPNLKKRGAD